MGGFEKSMAANFRDEYANRADFCELFETEMERFYLLAFLLTANHEAAEQCLASTVDKAFREQTVFKEWARSWVKRSLIKTAIDQVRPAPARKDRRRDAWRSGQDETRGSHEINGVTRLEPVERFIFVLSVLEDYSMQECSLLLGYSMISVAPVRNRALRQLPEVDAPRCTAARTSSDFLEVPA